MAALSKEARIKLFIAIDVAFFLLEIIVGYTAHSLALIADAFHMLNDVLSLCVGLWAVKVATNRSSSNEYTYGVSISLSRDRAHVLITSSGLEPNYSVA